jgi:integrase
MRGDGTIYLRSEIYWIGYYGPNKDGHVRKIRESSHSKRESDAKKLLKQRIREVGNDRAGIRRFQGPKAERITVAELIDDLLAEYDRQRIKSALHMEGRSKRVREFFGFRRAVSVTPDVVREYIEQRKVEKAAIATINRELALLKRAFSLANEEQKLTVRPYIPMAGPEDNVRSGFFEIGEIARMLKHLDPVMAEMTRLGFRTGWRASEIRLLTWSRVDRTAREIRLDTTKNGRPRLLPLDDELAALFERCWRARQYTKKDRTTGISEFVFHEAGHALTQSVFAKRWAAARDAAGLAGRLFHDLRRSAVRNLVRSGVAETIAMSISGHLTRSVFDRYNISSTEDTLAALKQQGEFLKNQPASNVAYFAEESEDALPN